MKTQTHFKYIEWHDPKGLHDDIINTLSDIKFIEDELHFLRDLITEHTLELIHEKTFEESKKIAEKLDAHEHTAQQLFKDLKKYQHNLQSLLDDVEIPYELENYKDIHYKLMIRLMGFYADVKKTKRQIFKTFAELMKKDKQKRLL